MRRRGFDITAVAVSDSHHAGTPRNPGTQTPIGVGTTVVYAPELSERGIRRGIRAGRAYVKVFGPGGPDLRLSARAGRRRAIMGDWIRGRSARLVARVIGGVSRPGAGARKLVVLKDGARIAEVPVTSDDFRYRFRSTGRGGYRIQLERGAAVEALTNPITLGKRRRR